MGRQGVESMIDRCCAHCEALVSGIGVLPGVEVLHTAMLNQGLIRFRREGQTSEQDDAFTDETVQKINATVKLFSLALRGAASRHATKRRELAHNLTRRRACSRGNQNCSCTIIGSIQLRDFRRRSWARDAGARDHGIAFGQTLWATCEAWRFKVSVWSPARSGEFSVNSPHLQEASWKEKVRKNLHAFGARGRRCLFAVVKDDAHRFSMTRTQAAHSMT
jgi:hypothetical protein